jgi:hypothetical protein
VKPKKKASASVETAAAKPKTTNLVVPTQSSASPLEDISDLLDHLPIQACVELTRRLLNSISSLPTQRFASRSPSHPSMCGADSSATQFNFLPPHRGRSPVACPEDHYSLCGRIWAQALGRHGVNPCASPAGMRTKCVAGSWNWSIFYASTASIFVSKVRNS